MTRKLLTYVLAFLLTCGALAAYAQTPTDASIRQLLEVTDAKALMLSTQEVKDQMMEQIKSQLRTLYPEMTPAQNAVIDQMMTDMMKLFNQELSWSSLEPVMMDTYRNIYTQAEVDAMIRFYNSPEGQSIVKKMPEFTREIVNMIQQRTIALMPELQHIQAGAIAKLQAMQ